jgi:hypothetical protein
LGGQEWKMPGRRIAQLGISVALLFVVIALVLWHSDPQAIAIVWVELFSLSVVLVVCCYWAA